MVHTQSACYLLFQATNATHTKPKPFSRPKCNVRLQLSGGVVKANKLPLPITIGIGLLQITGGAYV